MRERSPPSRPGRPFGVQLLAALLTWYAMAGFFIAASLVSGRPDQLRWEIVAGAALLFAIASGLAARSVWSLASSAPRWLVACGIAGAALCVVLVSSMDTPAGESRGDMWRAAIIGAVLFVAFLALAARYVSRHIRSRS